MIVDPDFLDHWRTGMVTDAIGDPMAPVYILRLWAHCQGRKSDQFVMPAAGLKAQCRYPADAKVFEQALIDAGFIRRDGETVIVIGWAEKNASLIASWENGGKGGRPKKPAQTTQQKPMGNPTETQGEPMGNPNGTHAKPIREEKRREDKNEEAPSSLVAAKSPRPTRKAPESFLVDAELQAWARENAPGVDLRTETDCFRDYTFKNAISDWPAAWRNWIRKASQARTTGRAQQAPIETFRERDARLAAERVAAATGGILSARRIQPIQPFEVIDAAPARLA